MKSTSIRIGATRRLGERIRRYAKRRTEDAMTRSDAVIYLAGDHRANGMYPLNTAVQQPWNMAFCDSDYVGQHLGVPIHEVREWEGPFVFTPLRTRAGWYRPLFS